MVTLYKPPQPKPAPTLEDLNPKEQAFLLQRAKEEKAKKACQRSFLEFLPYWQFINRETGKITSFADLWPGQREFAELATQRNWILALKAGKLGFTELECAYDAWIALFGPPNTRVHVFSRTDLAAQELIGYIRFGVNHLPDYLRPKYVGKMSFEKGQPTTATQHTIKFHNGTEDIRKIVSYAAGQNVSVEQSCMHAHVDELARMPFPKQTWQAVYTTVAPEGSCHIVTRGAGEANFVATLWKAASAGTSKLYSFFQPWSQRPDRDRRWYEVQGGSMTLQGLHHYAPETPEDALAGDEESEFLPIILWDRCWDREMSPFDPGDPTPCILGVDAAVTSDCFGVVAVTRHPDRHDDVVIRAVRKWDPPQGGAINFLGPEGFIRFLCQGGCAAGHPQYEPYINPDCEACQSHILVPAYNIVQIAYDPYQLESMMQGIRRDLIAWCEPFSQMKDRYVADSELRDMVINRRLTHNGDRDLREHIQNAAAKIQLQEDSRIRIVKKAPDRKVDLAVATSMAVHRCRYLVI